MAVPEIIESSVTPSTFPGAAIFNCKWECDGVFCYSSMIIEYGALTNLNLWNDMVTQVAIWFKARRRKNGEIACLPTCPSTSKPSA
jgi:hypothetical protein